MTLKEEAVPVSSVTKPEGASKAFIGCPIAPVIFSKEQGPMARVVIGTGQCLKS